MCGITGFLSKEKISYDQLVHMNDTIIYRGPDDSGVELFDLKDGYTLGLAQRRLSILDLSPLGHQPMHSDNGRITVIYNGEIYNFLELKEELKEYEFKSTCDTEVIIAAYLKWGIECVNKFNGMFAICIYDREDDSIYLVRDRIGKKPLYYELENGNIYFASELKPIMDRPGFKGTIRQEVMARYLYQLYINAPDTIFENVYKLEAGSILKFRYGEVTTWKYWDVKTVYHNMQLSPVDDYNQAKTELKELLKKSVSLRMISDVPLGTFLSGGYDSSLISAIAQELSDRPVKTFSIGFNEEGYNEAVYAKEVARHLGTDHTELYIDEKMMFELVDSIPKYYDEPFADSSQIPTMLVSGLAKRDVTVALSGDGGDEFFCGYNVYKNVLQAQKLDAIGGMVHGVSKLLGIEDKLPFKVRIIAANRDKETKTQIGSDNYIIRANQMVRGEQLPCKYRNETEYGVKNWQTRRMLVDMDTYIVGDILCKVDRASMKYSLESRCPILDKDVMEYSFRINHNFKYNNGDKKHILKDIAYDYIPKELLDRPKVGFGVPLDKWLRGPLKEKLTDMCSLDYLKGQNIFEAEYVHNMIYDYLATGDGGPATGRNYSKITWGFFVFQQWYETYMKK